MRLLGAGIDTINAYFFDSEILEKYQHLVYKNYLIKTKKFYYSGGRLDTSHLRTNKNQITDMIREVTDSEKYTLTRVDSYIDLDVDLLIFSRILTLKRFKKILFESGSVFKVRDRMLRVYDKRRESKRKRESVLYKYDDYEKCWRFEWQLRFAKNKWINSYTLRDEIESNFYSIKYRTLVEKKNKVTPYKILIYKVLKEFGLDALELISSVEKNQTRKRLIEDTIIESIEEIDLRKEIEAGLEQIKKACELSHENELFNYERIKSIKPSRKV